MPEFDAKVDINTISDRDINDIKNQLNSGLDNLAEYILSLSQDNIEFQELVDQGILKGSGFVDYNPQGNTKENPTRLVAYNATHAPYMEMGTRPHMPPVQPLYEWVIRNVRVIEEGGEKQYVSKPKEDIGRKLRARRGRRNKEAWGIAWAIAMTIKRQGTQPRPFLEPALEQGSHDAARFFKIKIGGVG